MVKTISHDADGTPWQSLGLGRKAFNREGMWLPHKPRQNSGLRVASVAEESCFDAVPTRKKETAVPEVFHHQQVCVGSWKREFLEVVHLLEEHNQSAFSPTG